MKISKSVILLLILLFTVLSIVHGVFLYAFLGSDYHALKITLDNDPQQAASFLAIALAISTFVVFVIYGTISNYMLSLEFSKKIRGLDEFLEGEFAEELCEEMRQTKTVNELDALYGKLSLLQKGLVINKKSMKRLAYFDQLTGLPNRSTLETELKAQISLAERHNTYFAVFLLDIDNFKGINDSLGHDVGDKALIELSSRIKKQLRVSDYVVREDLEDPESGKSILTRLGGDEFTILITDVENPNAVSKVADRILRSCGEPMVFEEIEVHIGVSIGIALYPQDATCGEGLLKNADLAMYESKHKGKNQFEFFSKDMNAVAFQRLTMEKSIRDALDDEEFVLYFHPRVTAEDDSFAGFEALIRWDSKEQGLVSPGQFIPLAEESTLVCDIGNWVFDSVCRQIRLWRDRGYTDVSVSMNLSAMQIYHGDTYNMLRTYMQLHKVPGENLEIEVKEECLLRDEKAAFAFLKKVRSAGVCVALDGFGAEKASLNNLRDLPIDVLKIDRSYVSDIHVNGANQKILSSIIEIAHTFGLRTVVEGVENAEQLDFVKNAGCDFVQGFYHSKPIPSDNVLEYMANFRPFISMNIEED